MAEISTGASTGADAERKNAILIFALCFAAALVEGYDLQSAGVAAPKFAPIFGLSPSQLGLVFSFNTLGLFFGAALGGIMSDRIGRRFILITSMFLFGIFSIGTAYSFDVNSLYVMRFLTGLGLGGAMPNLIAMVAETGNSKNQAMRVTMITAGIPLGGSLASLFAWLGGSGLDWEAIFWVGGIAPILVGLVMVPLLPESSSFVQSRNGSAQSGREPVMSALFGNGRAARTLLLWAGFFFTLVVLYLILNWLPSLLIGKGFVRADATLGTLFFAFGGAVGAVALGLLMKRFGWKLIVAFSYLGMAGSLFAMSIVGQSVMAMVLAAFAIGFFVIGAQYLLYGLSPTIYPSRIRGTGVGWGVAVGRLGSVAGPAIAGALLAAGNGPSAVLMAMLPVIAIAFVAVLVLTWTPLPETD
jgi:MFS transporter, AAHS family, 3-hydroxyphenylpropionic acid transporter